MKKSVKIIFFMWSFMSVVIILILLFFETKKILDYFSDTFSESQMHVVKIQDIPSSRKRGLLINGKMGEEEVYFDLDGTDEADFFAYYNEIPLENRMKFKNISALNLIIPIVKFESTNNVLLIKKGSTFDKTINQWLSPNIVFLIIALFPILIYPIIKKIP